MKTFFIQSPDALLEEDALSWTKEEYRPKNLRIIAPKGSTAQEYANANNIKFAAMPDVVRAAGGVLAAYNSSPLYLVGANLEDSQKALLADTIADKIFVFGGKGAVSKNTEAQLIMNLKY